MAPGVSTASPSPHPPRARLVMALDEIDSIRKLLTSKPRPVGDNRQEDTARRGKGPPRDGRG